MRFSALVASALACLALGATTASPAMAADTIVDFTQYLKPAFEGVLAAVGVLALWLGRKVVSAIQERAGIELDDQLRARVDDALKLAIQFGKGRVLKFAEGRRVEIDVRSEVLKHALIYAQESVPDALNYFDIDQARLHDMLEARLGIDLDLDGDIAGKPA